jgi:hypothetical protein
LLLPSSRSKYGGLFIGTTNFCGNKKKNNKMASSSSPSSSPASWRWIQGVEIAIADPIDPTCPEDTRPALKDLITEHADKIAKIKAGIIDHPHYEESKHNDLWIVRFFLSQKKSKAALDAKKQTLYFPTRNSLDDEDIRSTPPHRVEEGEVFEFFERYQDDTVVLTRPHQQRGVVVFLRLSRMDQHRLVAELSEDHWLATFVYISEWCNQRLDYTTRTTGRFTRSVRIADTDGMKLSLVNRECLQRNVRAVGQMEDYYPQLLESLFLCNPPTFFKGLFNVIKATVLPKRMVETIDMINPKQKGNKRKCLYRHISKEDLPDKYGGKNPAPVEE